MNILKEKDNFLILTHKKPDGDTLGSASALCRGLRSMGKTAYVLENMELTEKYASLFDGIVAPEDFKADVIISTDIADEQLFPKNAEIYKGKVDFCIDHHPSNTYFAKESLVKADRAACGEIIYEVLESLDIEITKEMATAIYVAVSTDTGCFKFSNTTANTHIVAAKCLDIGIDGGELNRKLFEIKTISRFKLEKYLFENMEFFFDGKLAIATITSEILQSTKATVDDRDSIASIPRQIEGVLIGVTITEQKDGCKISVRTTKEVSATDICKPLGGGGHIRAAGATLNMDAETVKEKIVEIVWGIECITEFSS